MRDLPAAATPPTGEQGKQITNQEHLLERDEWNEPELTASRECLEVSRFTQRVILSVRVHICLSFVFSFFPFTTFHSFIHVSLAFIPGTHSTHPALSHLCVSPARHAVPPGNVISYCFALHTSCVSHQIYIELIRNIPIKIEIIRFKVVCYSHVLSFAQAMFAGLPASPITS